jgi:hypothetical protein
VKGAKECHDVDIPIHESPGILGFGPLSTTINYAGLNNADRRPA